MNKQTGGISIFNFSDMNFVRYFLGLFCQIWITWIEVYTAGKSYFNGRSGSQTNSAGRVWLCKLQWYHIKHQAWLYCYPFNTHITLFDRTAGSQSTTSEDRPAIILSM